MLFQAICVGLVVMFGKLDWSLGMCNFDRPIVLCPLVGLVMGDLSQGIIVGIALELLFLGNIAIGAAATPDVIVGGVMGCAFSMTVSLPSVRTLCADSRRTIWIFTISIGPNRMAVHQWKKRWLH